MPEQTGGVESRRHAAYIDWAYLRIGQTLSAIESRVRDPVEKEM